MPALPKISPEIIEAYKQEIQKSSSASTAKRKLISLNRFFDWASSKGHIDGNPIPQKQNDMLVTTSPRKRSILSLANFAKVGMLVGLTILVFALTNKLSFPIPFVFTPAKEGIPESKIQTTNQNGLISPIATNVPQNRNTNTAVSAGNENWKIYANLELASPQVLSFKLYKSKDDSVPIWESTPLEIKPDSEGSSLISFENVPTNLFFENKTLHLGIEKEGVEIIDRIPVSTANTPIVDGGGNVLLAGESPVVKSSGDLLIEGNTITIKTTDGGDGNIEINPDGRGIAHFLFEGTGKNFLNAQGPNMSSGSLYYGIVANNSAGTGYSLLKLQSGSSPTTKFSVDGSGNTFIDGKLTVDDNVNITGGGGLQIAGVTRLTNLGRLASITGYYQDSGTFVIDQGVPDYAKITKTLSTATGPSTADTLTLTLDESTLATGSGSDTLVINRLGGTSNGLALFVDNGNARFDGQLQLGNFSSNPTAIGSGSLVFNTGDNKVYVWNGTIWQAVGSTELTVEEGDVAVDSTINDIDFLGGDFDISESPEDEANIQLAATLTSVVGVVGDFSVGGGDITAGGSALTLGSISTPSVTITTNGTGDAELVVPNDSIGTTEINDNGASPSDEYCLTYEGTGGIFEWQNCGSAASVAWSSLTAPSSDLTLTMATFNTTFNWDPGANSAETNFSLTTQGEDSIGGGDEDQVLLALSQTDNGVDVDEAADTLLSLTNNDSNDPVNSAIRFDAGAAGVDFTYGINFDAASIGTAEIVLQNSETIDNVTDGTVLITSPTTALSGDLTISGTTGVTFLSTGGINLAGGTISDSVDEVDINDSLAISSVLQVGGTSALTYSRFGTATTGHGLSTADDVLIGSDLELDGVLYLDGRTISNPAGTAAMILCTTGGSDCSSTSTIVNTLTSGSWLIENTNNTTQPALKVNQTQSGYIFQGTASSVSKFIIDNQGQMQIGNIASTPTALGAGAMYFNSTTNTFQCYNGTNWFNCGGTLYSNTNASVADGSYITVTHNLATNDLLADAWINSQSTWKLLNATYQPAIAWEGKDTVRGSYHDEVNLYKASEETNIYTENLLQSGLLFDTLEDSTKTDSANTTASTTTQKGDDGSANYMTLTDRVQAGRTGLMGGQTYNSSTSDNDGQTYMGSNTVNDIYYYDRTKDSSPEVLVELGIDPNWYNGVTLSVATTSAQLSQNSTVLYDKNPNLSVNYNGSLIKATGTDSSPKTIFITIKSPTTFDWTNYDGDSATAVTMTPGTAQTLGSTGVSVTFTATSYNVGDVFRIASWFIEAEGTYRGAKQQFPERTIIVGADQGLSIIDSDTQKVWMRAVSVGAGWVSTDTDMVDALNGKVYGAQSGSAVNFADFATDRIGIYGSGGLGIGRTDIAGRNVTQASVAYTLPSPSTLTGGANDIDVAVIPNAPTQEVTVSGWGAIATDGSSSAYSEAVNLPYKFNATPNIVTMLAGSVTRSGGPLSLADCSSGEGATGIVTTQTYGLTDHNFNVKLNYTGLFGGANQYRCYTWTAKGVVSPKQFAVIAIGAASSDGGETIINETDGTSVNINIGSQYGPAYRITKTALANDGSLYNAVDDSTTPRSNLSVYYGIAGITSSETTITQYQALYYGNNEQVGWSGNGPTFLGTNVSNDIKSLAVSSGASTIDGVSNTIYIGTGSGLSVIQEKQGHANYGDGFVESSGSVKYYTKDYISEEMVGDIRGMWSLNNANASSDFEDNSVKAETLTGTNITAAGDSVSGVRNTATDFDGSTEYLSCTDANCGGTTELDGNGTSTTAWSVGGWIKTGTNNASVLWKNPVNTGYGLLVESNVAKFRIVATSAVGVTTVTDNNWHHLIGTYDGSNIRVYVDGQLEGVTAYSGGVPNVAGPFTIGAYDNSGTPGYYTNGYIDETFVTGTTLSSSQIRHMYQVGYRALQSHGTGLGGGSADANQNLGYISTGTNTVGVIAPDYNNQYMYVGLNSTTLGGLSKIQLNSDTNIKTYNSSANVPSGGPLIVDEDVTSLGVGYTLEAVGSAASGVKSMGVDNNATATSGNFVSKTYTLPKNIASAVLWVSPILDSSDGSNTFTVKASNDGGSVYNTCTLVNTNSNPPVPEREYACTFTASNNSLKVKFEFVRGSTKTNTYVTQYGITWLGQTGFRVEQADANNVRLYNYSGETQNLKLNVTGASTSALANPWTDAGSYLYPTGYESLRIYDGAGTNYLSIAHDGTNGTFDINGTTLLTLSSAGDLSPNTDDSQSLGTNTKRWKDIFLGPDTLHIGTSTTDEGTISYNTTSNILGIGTDSTTNGDIAFFTDDLYLDKSSGFVGLGDTTPSYQLEVYDPTNTPTFALSDDDIAHGVTTLANTDVFGLVSSVSTTVGGLQVTGLADATGIALGLKGVQSSDPTDTTPAISLIGTKASGTGVQDLADAETVLQIANNDNTAALTVLGNGNIGIGTATPNAKLEVAGNIAQSSGFNALGDQGTMVGNGGFEINNGSTTPDGWTGSISGTAAFGLTSTSPAQGTWSATLQANTGVGNQSFFVSTCFPITGGRIYNLYDRIKANTATTTGHYLRLGTYTTQANCTAGTTETAYDSVANAAVTTSYADAGGTVTPAATQLWGKVYIINVNPNVTATFTVDSIRVVPSSLASGLDLAENYPVLSDDTPQPGDLVTMGRPSDQNTAYAVKTNQKYDPDIFGVISTQPGEILDDGENYLKASVALAGRVPLKVTRENGPIAIGDYLTSSSTPGVAMKSTKAGRVIGKSLESYDSNDPSSVGRITVFINPTWYDPGVVVAGIDDLGISLATSADTQIPEYVVNDPAGKIFNNVSAFAKIIAANIKAGSIETQDFITERLVAKVIKTDMISPVPNGNNVTIKVGGKDDSTGKVAIQNNSGEEVASIDNEGNANFAGDVYANNIHSQNLDEIEQLLSEVQADQSVLSDILNTNSFTATESASLDELALSDLYVTNQAAVNSLSVAQSFSLGADFVIQAQDSAINTLSAPLKIQSLAMAPIELMAGKIRIDTNGGVFIEGNVSIAGNLDVEGDIKTSKLVAENLVIASSQEEATPSAEIVPGDIEVNTSIGRGIIPAEVNEITITNTKVGDYSLIYVTPTSTTQNRVLYVKNKGAGFFTVGFTDPLDSDVEFNWWIVETSVETQGPTD